jgi:hypothetical protein
MVSSSNHSAKREQLDASFSVPKVHHPLPIFEFQKEKMSVFLLHFLWLE